MVRDIWVYAFRNPLSESQLGVVREKLDGFVSNWKSHGQETPGEYFYNYNQFFFLHNPNPESLSGCSIDSLMHVFQEIKLLHQLDALNDLFFYRDKKGSIVSVEKYNLKKKIEAKELNSKSIVFNNDINSKKEFFEKPWESELSKSWVFIKYRSLFDPVKH